MVLQSVPGLGRSALHRLRRAAAARGVALADLVARPLSEVRDRVPGDVADLAMYISAADASAWARAPEAVAALEHAGVRFILDTDPGYPPQLAAAQGLQTPPVLCAMGAVSLLDQPGAAVVGARTASPAALEVARQCGGIVARRGTVLISGGADGVDWAAHVGALEAGGSTVLVMPQGVQTYDAPERILDAAETGRALLLSEWPPAQPWATFAAVARNATMAALARFTVVIEPKSRGGSLRTGEKALGYGRPVYVYAERYRAHADELHRAGAQPLPMADGAVDSAALAAAGAGPRDEAPVQSNLH